MSGAKVRLGGPLREHLAAAVAQLDASTPYSVDVVVQDVRVAADKPRLFQDYHGDLSGRFLDAVAVAHAQGLPVDEAKTSAILQAILDSQHPDGFFGSPAPAARVDHGSAWGHGRLLEGLLAATDWAPPELERSVRRATQRLAEGIGARSSRWAAWVGAHAGQKFVLDPLSAVLPLTRYAERTGTESAIDTARVLSSALPAEVDDLHMHGYLLALRGRVELGRLTGEAELVDDVIERAAAVAENHLLPHGGVLESLARPWDVNTEGCGIADWVMLNLRLHALDGDPRFFDRAAQAAFNALLHAQRESGHFGCETLSEADGLLVSDYAPEAWWCCTFHGIRALQAVAEHAVVLDDEAVRVVLPIATTACTAPGRPVLSVETDYPYADQISIVVGDGFPSHGTLRLLVPSTASIAEVVVEGERVGAEAAGGWLTLDGLRPGGRVEVRLTQYDWFRLAGEASFPPFENSTVETPDLSRRRCAVFHGQLLLAAHAGDNALEDLLRARYLVHEPGEPALTVSGHDTFAASLRAAPLAGPDRRRNSEPARAWYAGLLHAPRRLH